MEDAREEKKTERGEEEEEEEEEEEGLLWTAGRERLRCGMKLKDG